VAVRLAERGSQLEPADIVGAILFLSSEDADLMSGRALVVDGGMYKIS
jgi:NAD(P)-dependent dehydrogenase (short-subunit alcohol dehydrogenase family)